MKNILIESKPDSLYKYKFEVRVSEGMLSMTDLCNEYEVYRHNNKLPKKNVTRIFTNTRFLLWLEQKMGIDISPNFNPNIFMKQNGLKKTISARETKNVLLESDIFYYFKEELFDNYKTTPSYKFEDKFYMLIKNLFDGVTEFKIQEPILNFRVDVFFPEHGICIEYDENYHLNPKQKEYDFDRENVIKEFTGHKFIRVKIGEEIAGINAILKEMVFY